MSTALAKLGYAYAEEALARRVDCNDAAIDVRGVKVSAHYVRSGDALEILIGKDNDTLELSGSEVRDVFEVVRGMLAADDQTDIEPSAALIASRAEMIDVIRLLRGNNGECIGDHPEWEARMDAILAKFPVKP